MDLMFALLLAFTALPDAEPEMSVAQMPTPSVNNVKLVDPEMIQAMLLDYGYDAVVDWSNPDDVVVEGYLNETQFVVILYGCEEWTACTGLEFATGYDFPNGVDPTHLNDWNRDTRFGAAYLDEQNDPVLTMDMNLAIDGIGRENFRDWLGLWHFLVEDFEAHLDTAPPHADEKGLAEHNDGNTVYEIGFKGKAHEPNFMHHCAHLWACR